MARSKKTDTDTLTDVPVEMQQPVTKGAAFSVTDVEVEEKTHEKPSQSRSKASNALGVYLVSPEAKTPEKASDEASCYDLYSAFEDGQEIKQIGQDNVEIPTKATKKGFTLHPRSRALVPTGIKLDIPKGYDVRVYPRSGISFKDGLGVVNSLGIIDNDYRGELFVTLINHTDVAYKVKSGVRIAQLELNKLVDDVILEQLKEYDDNATKRSTGGFGSTGEN